MHYGFQVYGRTTIYCIVETAKANNVKPYEYVEYVLGELTNHMNDKKRDFLKDLMPWSEALPEYIKKAMIGY